MCSTFIQFFAIVITNFTLICEIWTRFLKNIHKKYYRKEISKLQPPEVLCKKSALRNFAKFTGKHLCQNLFFDKVVDVACNFIKKETLAQVFSGEFFEVFKNIEHLWWLLLVFIFYYVFCLFVCFFRLLLYSMISFY